MSKISELTDGGSLLPTDFLIAVRSGGNVKVQADDITVDQINLGDNEFIRLGNSQDLTMVHTPTQSIINQAGTGDLLLQKAGSTKLTINTSGIDVTGTVTADGLTSVVTTDTQGKFSGWSVVGGNSSSGSIELGQNAAYQGLISYAADASTRFLFDNTYGSTSSTFEFRTNTSATAKTHLKILGSGDINLGYEDTGTTPKLFWDASAESLGIGTSSPTSYGATATTLEVKGASGSGIGALQLAGADGGVRALLYAGGSTDFVINTQSNHAMGFNTNNARAMTIDASGNLLVGKTASGTANTGAELRNGSSNHAVIATSTSATPLVINRKTNDGPLVNLYKDGTTVGSIGTEGGDMAIGNDDVGLQFINGGQTIRGFNMATNARIDAQVDLGMASTRFKDLYLSGGVYLGGTGAANKLDDYEEGTFTPTFVITNCTVTHDIQQGNYTKVGNTVFFHLVIGTDAATGSFSGSNVLITGMPFAASRSQTGAIGLSHSWASELDDPSWAISTGTTVMSFYKSDNAAGLVLGAQFATGGNSNRLDITGSYHTDS